jgi:hypothetical protein
MFCITVSDYPSTSFQYPQRSALQSRIILPLRSSILNVSAPHSRENSSFTTIIQSISKLFHPVEYLGEKTGLNG